MSTVPAMDDLNSDIGAQLTRGREQKGYSIEYVASKLHLRVNIIESIERNEFNLLPEPVFVKGYLGAYAKLLDIPSIPLVERFNAQYPFEKKVDRALWQSKRESNKAEHIVRWVTILFAMGVMVAVGLWWHKNKDAQTVYSEKTPTADVSLQTPRDAEVKLTDLSKMQALLLPKPEMSPLEKEGG